MENRLVKYLKRNTNINHNEIELINSAISRQVYVSDNPSIAPETPIYLLGCPGILGAKLIRDYHSNLDKHFSYKFLEKFDNKAQIVLNKVADNLCENDIVLRLPVAEMGLYGALFKLKDHINHGFDIYLSKIDLIQELIEITDLLDINPFRLLSGNCDIIIPTGNYAGIFEGIPEIGTIRYDNEMRLHIDDEFSLLNRPVIDEYLKYLQR